MQTQDIFPFVLKVNIWNDMALCWHGEYPQRVFHRRKTLRPITEGLLGAGERNWRVPGVQKTWGPHCHQIQRKTPGVQV